MTTRLLPRCLTCPSHLCIHNGSVSKISTKAWNKENGRGGRWNEGINFEQSESILFFHISGNHRKVCSVLCAHDKPRLISTDEPVIESTRPIMAVVKGNEGSR